MTNIKLFQDKKIRSVLNEEEEQWYFVIEDVVAALTDCADPKQYIKRMKLCNAELAKGWVQIVPTLAVQTSGGKPKNCQTWRKSSWCSTKRNRNWKKRP